MLAENRQINSISLVVLGDFNPAIVQPFWLSSKKLIKEEEASSSKVELIHNELVKYNIGDWLFLQITRERFEVRTTQEPYFAVMRDLVLSIFNHLKETPVSSLGINHIRHYNLSEKEYFKLGNEIAPLKNWSDLLENPQVLLLEILQKGKPNMPNGQVRIRIEPSDTLKAPNSFMINLNDHFTLTSTGLLQILLKEEWQNSFGLADKVESRVEQIIKR